MECLFAKFIGLVQHIKSDGFGGQNTFLQARNAGRNELVASVHTPFVLIVLISLFPR